LLFFIPTLFGWFSGNKEPEIIQAILKQEDDIKWALIVFAAMLFVLRKAENHMDNLWETTVSPVFKNIKKSLEEHISSVQKQATDRFANEFEEASRVLKSRNLIETMENTESEILKACMPEIQSKIYGDHTKSDHSLTAAVEKHLGRYFTSKAPHRSTYRKMINILPKEDGSFRWDEVSSYKIHSIAHDKDYPDNGFTGPEAPNLYPIHYRSSGLLPSIDSDLSSLVLKIKIDGKELIDSRNLIIPNDQDTFELEQNGYNMKIKREKRNILISFDYDIPINKAWTDVEIVEQSISSDTSITLHSICPTCKMDISVTVPDSYEIGEYALSNKDRWEVTDDPYYRLVVRNDGWVFPGLAAHISWRKRDSTQH
tara:strand:+ start:721 stop:1830 length:1110 start_codon:yes stop_codon:yes gene_type:complete